MAAKKVEVMEINLEQFNPKRVTISIVGDSDLVLNKMNSVIVRQLSDVRNDKAKKIEKPNKWEEIITSVHWLNGNPDEYTEETFLDKLKNDSPCITTHGVKEMLKDTVYRTGIDKNKTKMGTNVNVIGYKGGNLIPVKFTEHYLNELLMSPQRGKPILARLNCFKGWSADIELEYIDSVYSAEQLFNIMNVAGFGSGIGSSRNADFGRFHVESIK